METAPAKMISRAHTVAKIGRLMKKSTKPTRSLPAARLRGVEGISFVPFDDRDVVRHSLVQKIVRAAQPESSVGRIN